MESGGGGYTDVHISFCLCCVSGIFYHIANSLSKLNWKIRKKKAFLYLVCSSAIHILKFWEHLGKFFSKVQTLGVKTLTVKLHSSLEGSKWGSHEGIRLTPKEHHVGGAVVCHWLLGTEVATPLSGDGEGIDCNHVGWHSLLPPCRDNRPDCRPSCGNPTLSLLIFPKCSQTPE